MMTPEEIERGAIASKWPEKTAGYDVRAACEQRQRRLRDWHKSRPCDHSTIAVRKGVCTCHELQAAIGAGKAEERADCAEFVETFPLLFPAGPKADLAEQMVRTARMLRQGCWTHRLREER